MPRKSKSTKVIKAPAAGSLKEFNDVERAAARYMAGLFTMTKVMQAVAIAWFCGDEKFYRILGYTTEQEFMEMFAGKSRMQGYKYKEIGQAFLKAYPLDIPDGVFNEVEKSKGQNVKLLDISNTSQFALSFKKSDDLQKLAQFVDKIGIEKFYSLTQYEINYRELIDNEAVVLKDGQRLPLKDVIATTNRDLLAQIEKLNAQVAEKRHELTETKSRLEERARLAESENDRLRGIEEKFGPRAVKMEDKRRLLDRARDAHRDAVQFLVQSNIEDEDGDAVIRDLTKTLKEWGEDLSRMRELYGNIVLENAE
ncbi:hypothetical protein JW777_00780 [bacterium]|nr:hypothetical protein [bacterium]